VGDSNATAFTELVQLGRLMASAASPDEMHGALADTAASRLGVDAAAVLRVVGERLVLVAARNIATDLAAWSTDADELETVGMQVAVASGHAQSRMMLLVVGGDIYGALVLLANGPIDMTSEQLALADALVGLAATATERAERHLELARSYAELKASRDALARSERLRILGQMAAGISHDVKNILNPLGLQLEVLRRRIAKGDLKGADATIDTMRDVIRHGVDVVERLREFSRQAPEVPESVDVERVVATAVELSRPRVSLFAGVELIVEPIPPLRINARASELATALVNLIVNATEAMPDGGTITIAAGVATGEVWIKVCDNGPGMPPEVADNVFEPFFTTKKDGTGLGLAMIYAFVHRFSGRVTLESSPGKGSTVVLWFPAA
jgi:signal transduction histidine kinase